MNWYKQGQEVPIDFSPDIETPALTGPVNPLDNMTPAQAKKAANKAIPHDRIKGFFTDKSWQGVQRIWDAFNEAGLNWGIMGSEYSNDNGVPDGKNWQVEVTFTDKRGNPATIYGTVRASGAGTIEDPLSRYDVVAYFI